MPKWRQHRRRMVATKPTLPGVWATQDGDWWIRGRVTNPKTGRQVEISRFVEAATAAEALGVLEHERHVIRAGGSMAAQRTRFHSFAASLFASKVATGEIRSAAGRDKWRVVLEKHLIPVFGDYYLDALTQADIEEWRTRCGARVRRGQLGPATFNTWLSVLKVIMRAAKLKSVVEDVQPLPTTEHRTYTHEEPNSLEPADVPRFLAEMERRYPQFYAMTVLGFVTGLRPSHMRPLRRRGPTPDMLWEEKALLVRRSETLGEVMEATKTGRDQRLALPDTLVDILAEHVASLKGKAATSDLLFPSRRGGYRARSVLDQPFAKVAEALKLPYKVSARAMRRTFQDLARAAEIEDLVTRSISGHATEAMQEHYSTVREDEQRAAMARVIDLAQVRRERAA